MSDSPPPPVASWPEFPTLIQRAREGDQDACTELVKVLDPILRRCLGPILCQPVRRVLDSTDVVQDAWFIFFRGPIREQHFADPVQLLAFLHTLVHNLAGNLNRKYLDCHKRNLRRDRSLSESKVRAAADCPAPDPAPPDAAMRREQWDELTKNIDPAVARALRLLRDGHTYAEVAECIGLTPKMIQRLVASLRTKLAKAQV